ncbi:hypothetical protein ACI79D_23425 [Geodermatophilus sp. SYSU D00708]
MDLRRVVGGLLTRDSLLSALLLNYADRLQGGRSATTEPCFIVPSWDERVPDAPHETRVLTVAAHTCRDDPRPHDHLDAVLALLHEVLTGEEARRSITTRPAGTCAELQVGVDTVAKVATWEITLTPSQVPAAPSQVPTAPSQVPTAPSQVPTAPEPRLLPVPDLLPGRRVRLSRTGAGRRQPIGDPGAEGLPPASRAGSSSR